MVDFHETHNIRGVATVRARRTMAAPSFPPPPPPPLPGLQLPNQKRFNRFSFKHQVYYFLWLFRDYTDQKLLPCMLQFLDNLWQLFIFSNYLREIDHFTLDLSKRFDNWTFWKVSHSGPSERRRQWTRV